MIYSGISTKSKHFLKINGVKVPLFYNNGYVFTFNPECGL